VRTARGRELLRRKIAAAITADPSRTNHSIAHSLNCSWHTVGSVRDELARAAAEAAAEQRGKRSGVVNLIEPAGVGNSRAAKHGAYRPAVLEPIRARKHEQLRAMFPTVSDELLAVQSTRGAQLHVLWEWISEHGLVRDRHGNLSAAATFAAKLSIAYERQHDRLAEIEREARTERPAAALEALADELSDEEAA
jgi:hypothetical protein